MPDSSGPCLVSKYISKISETFDDLKRRHHEFSSSSCLFAFRGESRDYGATRLMPSLFRDGNIEKENYSFELLGDYGFLDRFKYRDIDKAIEAQHYLEKSRLLDICFNVLPALYFACNTNSKSTSLQAEEGFLYVFCFPEYYSSHSTYIEEYFNKILDTRNSFTPYANGFKVIMHSFSNDRIKAQDGGFIFFPGPDYKAISNVYYKKIPIFAKDKKQILNELESLFNINKASLYPEKEHLIETLKTKFENNSYKNRSTTNQDEIENALQRIDYEMFILNAQSNEDYKGVLRVIRKEYADLIYHITCLTDETDENKQSYIDLTKEKFDFLKLKYKEIENETIRIR